MFSVQFEIAIYGQYSFNLKLQFMDIFITVMYQIILDEYDAKFFLEK